MYRWWARRPHSLVSALLDAANATAILGTGGVVADPFSGGGTVAIEAARRGYSVYAQDLHPWPTWGLTVSLRPVDPTDMRGASLEFLRALRASRAEAYAFPCADHGDSHHVNVFRVRRAECPKCTEAVYLYPYPMISLASRGEKERRGFFGCKKCGRVQSHIWKSRDPRCDGCRAVVGPHDRPFFKGMYGRCPSCRKSIHAKQLKLHSWSVALVQRACRTDGQPEIHFSPPSQRDLGIDRSRSASLFPKALSERIPDGHETHRLLDAGFDRWLTLYPTRQLGTLLAARQVLGELEADEAVKERIALSIAGSAEMAGYLCRWDRYHPKIFEGLANHRYSTTGLAVEPNPLASVGRGSLERRLKASVVAAEWLSSQPDVPRVIRPEELRVLRPRPYVHIEQGNSAHQKLSDQSVSLVLTDPPYYDSIQYGELAQLFLTWMEVFGVASSTKYSPMNEAVPNRTRGTGTAHYQTLLTQVFKESARTLAPEGRLLLTFHSTNFRAWYSLAAALRDARFSVRALATTQAENPTDHPKRGKQSFINDLVIECVQGDVEGPPRVLTPPRNPEERELIRAGLFVATFDGSAYANGRAMFIASTRRMRVKRIECPDTYEIQWKGR